MESGVIDDDRSSAWVGLRLGRAKAHALSVVVPSSGIVTFNGAGSGAEMLSADCVGRVTRAR